MNHRPYEPEHPQERPRQSRGRPDAAKTGGAQGLVRQTEWLWHPVLFWTGAPPPDLASEEMPYTPLPSLLAERLASERPGLFTAHLVWPPASSLPGLDVDDARTHLDPRIHCRRVTSRQLSRAAQVLVASRPGPDVALALVEQRAAARTSDNVVQRPAAAAGFPEASPGGRTMLVAGGVAHGSDGSPGWPTGPDWSRTGHRRISSPRVLTGPTSVSSWSVGDTTAAIRCGWPRRRWPWRPPTRVGRRHASSTWLVCWRAGGGGPTRFPSDGSTAHSGMG